MGTNDRHAINFDIVKTLGSLVEKNPEKYITDYVYMTYDYAFFAGEKGDYIKMAELLRESLTGMIRIKEAFPDLIFEVSEIKDMIQGYHELMIELAEERFYELADEIHALLEKMLKIYHMKVKSL